LEDVRKGAAEMNEEGKIGVGQVLMFGFQKELLKALSQNCKKRLLASSCLPVLPSA
jgi:hypothetical protein